MDNSLKVKFSLNQNWISEKKAVVFGIFEGEEIPCGLGFKKETAEKDAEKIRNAASAGIAAAEKLHVHKVSFTLFGSPRQSAEDRLRAIFEGAALSLYAFDASKTKPKEDPAPKAV